MHFVRAGFRTLSMRHLILLEDGALEPEPKAIPPGVVRVTMTSGRVLDFAGPSAELIRRHLGLLSLENPELGASGDVASHEVGSGAAPVGGAGEAEKGGGNAPRADQSPLRKR